MIHSVPWTHIPGPNPLLHTGDKGEWDDRFIEAAGILEDHGKWYLYYHAIGGTECDGYQLGVAVADHPLGPFTKYEGNPILKVGAPGSEDDWHVAHAVILKQGIDEYLMWYTVKNHAEHFEQWNVCLATAKHPLGPWTKFEGNPILRDFGYVSGIAQVDGTYYCYSAYPIGSTGGEDYSPIALATAKDPRGPWTKYNDGAPIVAKGDWGEWDDGGYSDAAVVYSAGVFHMFLAGAKLAEPRRLTRESIGYAWSHDGIHFQKHASNPILPYRSVPNASSFSEPRVWFALPYIYVYHTLRYIEPWLDRHGENFLQAEDIGVQVLATASPFCIDMPILHRAVLEGDARIEPDATTLFHVGHAGDIALTVRCRFDDAAAKGICLSLHGSADGKHFDAPPGATLTLSPDGERDAQRTFTLPIHARWCRLGVCNPDRTAVRDLHVTIHRRGD